MEQQTVTHVLKRVAEDGSARPERAPRGEGAGSAAATLMPIVYDELRSLASGFFREREVGVLESPAFGDGVSALRIPSADGESQPLPERIGHDRMIRFVLMYTGRSQTQQWRKNTLSMTLGASSSIRNARHPELARFVNDRAIKRGDFTLVSGRKSSYYCDGKQVSFSGEGLALIADAIQSELRDVDFDAIGGMDMGATPIVAAVSFRMFQLGRPARSFIVRKEAKGHGTKKEIEGPLPEEPSRLVMVDDVVTSGGSIVQAIEAVRRRGHEVVLALSLLDRETGGREKLEALGVKYQPLVTISEIGIANDAGPPSPGGAE